MLPVDWVSVSPFPPHCLGLPRNRQRSVLRQEPQRAQIADDRLNREPEELSIVILAYSFAESERVLAPLQEVSQRSDRSAKLAISRSALRVKANGAKSGGIIHSWVVRAWPLRQSASQHIDAIGHRVATFFHADGSCVSRKRPVSVLHPARLIFWEKACASLAVAKMRTFHPDLVETPDCQNLAYLTKNSIVVTSRRFDSLSLPATRISRANCPVRAKNTKP